MKSIPRKFTAREKFLRAQYTTTVKASGRLFHVELQIENQRFRMAGEHSRAEAGGYRDMLAVALARITP